MQGESGGHVQAIGLIVFHFTQIVVRAFADDDMTGGAGTATAAGVFKGDAEIQAHVEDGFGFAVLAIGEFAGFKLYGFGLSALGGNDGDFGH